MILAFCDKSYIVQIMLIVKTFLKIVCYIAPPIIIITSIITFFKAITSGKEEDLKDSGKLLVRRIIAGLIIVFLPIIISYVFNSFTLGDKLEFLACFESASKERVESLRQKEEAEEKAERQAQEKEDEKKLKAAYEADQKKRGSAKQTFEEWKKEKEEKQRQQQQQQQQSGSSGETVGGTLPDGNITPVKVGANGVNVKQFSGSGINMKYYEIAPSPAKSNMPIIVFLHGSGETGSVGGVGNLPIVSFVANNYNRSNQPFIFLAPIAPSHGWNGNNAAAAKAIIDKTIQEYNADRSRIYLTGMSMGGYGTWYMVSQYQNYFRAAMPMSGCSDGYNPAKYVNTPIYAIVGSSESSYKNCLNNLVNKINNQGGKATLDVVQGASHSTIQRYYKNEKLFNWLLSQ